MSSYAYLICMDCLSQAFIGWFDPKNKKSYIYIDDADTRQRIAQFLPRHLGHSLVFLHDQHSDYEEIEHILGNDSG